MVCAKCRCGEVVRASDNLAGRVAKCPKCAERVPLPSLVLSGPEHPAARRALEPWMIVAALGVGLLLGGAGIAGLMSIRQPQLVTSETPKVAASPPVAVVPPAPQKPKALAPPAPAPSTEAEKKERLHREIWQEAVAAEDRAIWEGHRLFAPSQTAKYRYIEEATERYTKELLERRGITQDDLDEIGAEAILKKWQMPKHPSCDVVAAAKSLGIKVPVDHEAKTYHRSICPVVGSGGLPTIPLDQVVADPALKPCPQCEP
jgi:hypothetical protein